LDCERLQNYTAADILILPIACSIFAFLYFDLFSTPLLVVSDANKGLIAAIRESFPGASWQRCKVHFMRNILAHVPQKEKESFAAQLKEIWLAPSAEIARQRAEQISEQYGKRFPKAIEFLEDGLEDSLAFYAFPELDARKISSTNMLERLNKEIRRRTSVVGIFPNPDSYLRLVTTCLMEYAEDWSVSRAYLNPKSIQILSFRKLLIIYFSLMTFELNIQNKLCSKFQ
jgi:putative transposase